MAATTNARDIILAAAPVRNADYNIPSNATYTGTVAGDVSGTVSGNVTGFVNGTGVATIDNGALRANAIFNGTGAVGNGTTIGGVATSGVWNTGISLSSVGALLGGGGGQVTNGASIGFLNAGNITAGTLLAARIGANTITASMMNVGTLSAITANMGTVTAGSITSATNINTFGQGIFNGSSSGSGFTAAVNGNTSLGQTNGVVGGTASGSGAGVVGVSFGGGPGVRASGGFAFSCQGSMAMTSSQIIGNMFVERSSVSNSTDFVAAGNVSGTVSSANFANSATNASNATNATNASNSNSLGGTAASGWCRGIATNSGTASAASFGFGLSVTGSLGATVRTRASGNNVFIENISDRRLKTQIRDETYGLSFVNSLRPRTYRWKAGNTKYVYHNFIAQEVLKNLKDKNDGLVMANADGTLGVGDMSSILTKAIQELSSKLDEANKQIDLLLKDKKHA